jgi:hypothetical protein
MEGLNKTTYTVGIAGHRPQNPTPDLCDKKTGELSNFLRASKKTVSLI